MKKDSLIDYLDRCIADSESDTAALCVCTAYSKLKSYHTLMRLILGHLKT